MNRDQYTYDIGVQILNRSNDIKVLELKLDRLKALRSNIYKRGQADKRMRRRENTLIEYREKVCTYDEKIQQVELLADTLKRRNGLKPLFVDTSSSSVRKTPTNISKTPTNISKTPTNISKTLTNISKTPTNISKTSTNISKTSTNISKTPTNISKTPTNISKTPTNDEPPSPPYYPFILGGGDSDSPTSSSAPIQKNDTELQDWIIQFYDLEFNTLEKINKTLVALEQEITATADALETQKKNQRECCF